MVACIIPRKEIFWSNLTNLPSTCFSCYMYSSPSSMESEELVFLVCVCCFFDRSIYLISLLPHACNRIKFTEDLYFDSRETVFFVRSSHLCYVFVPLVNTRNMLMFTGKLTEFGLGSSFSLHCVVWMACFHMDMGWLSIRRWLCLASGVILLLPL